MIRIIKLIKAAKLLTKIIILKNKIKIYVNEIPLKVIMLDVLKMIINELIKMIFEKHQG